MNITEFFKREIGLVFWLFMIVIMLLTGCGYGADPMLKDYTYEATITERDRPAGDNPRMSFNGYIYDARGDVEIILISIGDTILKTTTDEQTYAISWDPARVMQVHFKNSNKTKIMLFVNFTDFSERETYDVSFRNKDNVTFVKEKPKDNVWKVLYWRPSKDEINY